MKTQFNTLKIVGTNIVLTNPPCFWNNTERNSELKEATEICENLKKENAKKKYSKKFIN